MSEDEASYYRQRAEEEILRACQATDSREVAIHYALGNLYLDRLFAAASGEPPPESA